MQIVPPVPAALQIQNPLKRTYRTAAVGKINSLDPSQISTVSEKMVISNLVETLFQRNNQSGEIGPRAILKYQISPDGLNWKLFLRKDLYWSNGKKIKAKDYEVALRRLLKPKTKAAIATRLTNIKGATEMLEGAFYNPDNLGISSIDTTKQCELDITLNKPDPTLIVTLTNPATGPIPADLYEDRQDQIFNVSEYVSSGPFVISQKSPTSYILQKNRNHRFYSAIQIDEVQFFVVSSVDEGEKMFLSGLLDEFGYPDLTISPETLSKLAGTGYLVFQPDLHVVFMRLNIKQSPTNQFQLRQAIAMSINPQQLIDTLGFEGEKKASSIVPEELKFYDPPHGYYSNQTSGKDMLTNLGYCDKKGCNLLPRLTLLYPDTLPMKKIAFQFESQLKDALSTTQVFLKAMDVPTFLNAVEKSDYVLALDEIVVGPDEPFGLLHAFVTGNVLSGGYSNKEYDQLIQQAISSSNVIDMTKYYREAESLLLRDIAVFPLLFEPTPILLQKRVAGFNPNIWNLHPFEALSLR